MSPIEDEAFRFIFQTSLGSIKEKELEIAKLRSHAAKVSHAKRRQKQQDSLRAHDKSLDLSKMVLMPCILTVFSSILRTRDTFIYYPDRGERSTGKHQPWRDSEWFNSQKQEADASAHSCSSPFSLGCTAWREF